MNESNLFEKLNEKEEDDEAYGSKYNLFAALPGLKKS